VSRSAIARFTYSGKPETTRLLFEQGVDSVDSSAYVKLAADGHSWSTPDILLNDPTPHERLHLALQNLAVASGAVLPFSVISRAVRFSDLNNFSASYAARA
jgi:hypothetical protein